MHCGRRVSIWAMLALVACRPAAAPTPAAPSPAPVSPMTDHEPPVARAPALAPPWTLSVADGSGNVYACAHAVGGVAHYEYRPVTPATSSSGTYSGGPPRAGALTDAEVERLWQEVERVVADTTGHVPARAMGTVKIEAEGPTKASVIVQGPAGAALLEVLAGLPARGSAGGPRP